MLMIRVEHGSVPHVISIQTAVGVDMRTVALRLTPIVFYFAQPCFGRTYSLGTVSDSHHFTRDHPPYPGNKKAVGSSSPTAFGPAAFAKLRKKSRGGCPRLLVIGPVRVSLLGGVQAAGTIRQGDSDSGKSETRVDRVVEGGIELNHLVPGSFLGVLAVGMGRLRSQ
jgi:hypothetical protein